MFKPVVSNKYFYVFAALIIAMVIPLKEGIKRVQAYPSGGDDYRFPMENGFYYYSSTKDVILDRHFDGEGVLITDYVGDIGEQYNPVAIASYVLSMVPYYESKEISKRIKIQLDFLMGYANQTPNGNFIYPYYFDWPSAEEKSPWYSAMAQGEVASAMLWGNRIFNDPQYYNTAKKSIYAMMEDDSQFVVKLEKGIWLKEYPEYSYFVLDGSLASMAGIYDLYRSLEGEDERKEVQVFLDKALLGLKSNYKKFISPYMGHYFDNRGYHPTDSYYKSNISWLAYLEGYAPEIEQIKDDLSIPNVSGYQKTRALINDAVIHFGLVNTATGVGN